MKRENLNRFLKAFRYFQKSGTYAEEVVITELHGGDTTSKNVSVRTHTTPTPVAPPPLHFTGVPQSPPTRDTPPNDVACITARRALPIIAVRRSSARRQQAPALSIIPEPLKTLDIMRRLLLLLYLPYRSFTRTGELFWKHRE